MIYMQEINKVAAIAGPSELLLYPCDRFITSWDFEDQQQFKHISRDDCIKELQKTVANGDVSKDAFVDACLLAGSRFLPTLPSLESAPRDKMAKPLAAIDLMWSHGRTGINTVRDMSEDPRLKELHYFDNYCKVRSAIRYEPIITVDGAVESRYQAQMPNDANEFIDHRLPEELFYYLSRGLIDPRILTWRIRGEVIETIPPDGGEPVAYRELISSKLVSCRKTVLNLLSESLHNWFQHVSVTQRCWFLDASTGRPVTNDLAMNIREETRDKVGSWNVQEETFASVVSQYKVLIEIRYAENSADTHRLAGF